MSKPFTRLEAIAEWQRELLVPKDWRDWLCTLLTLLSILTPFVLFHLFVHQVICPTQPQFNLHHVNVDYLHISRPNDHQQVGAAAYLSLHMTLLFAVVNPNRGTVTFHDTNLRVSHRGVPLGTAPVDLEWFWQRPNSTGMVVSTVSLLLQLNHSAAHLLLPDNYDSVEIRVTGGVESNFITANLTLPQVPVDCLIGISTINQSVISTKCGDT